MENKKISIVLDAFIIGFLILLISGTIIAWSKLPSEIPNHIDSMGRIEDYMTKNFLFFPVCIGGVLGGGILLLSKHPKLYNYPVEITEENREKQYFLAVIMMKVLSIEVLSIFTYMNYCIIMVKNCSKGMLILVVMIFFTLLCYWRSSIKNK